MEVIMELANNNKMIEMLKRPQFKCGKYVHINDKFIYHGWEHTVKSMEYDENGWWIFSENSELFEPWACEYVEPDTIKRVWEDAKNLEQVLTSNPDEPGAVTNLLQRLEKIIREEYKSKEK